MLKADAYLIEKTKEFMSAFIPMKREQELYLAAYTHLRALEFMHHLQFEITTNRAIPNDRTINNMQIDFSHICKNIPPAQGVTIQAHTPFMSLSDVPAFCIKNASEIARLVSAATGFTYNKRDILTGKDATRALVSLAVYLASSKLPSDENPNPIGVAHIVAAFCSVLHQRKMKSKPMASRRYSSRLISPQKQLDAFIARKERSYHQPHLSSMVKEHFGTPTPYSEELTRRVLTDHCRPSRRSFSKRSIHHWTPLGLVSSSMHIAITWLNLPMTM